MFTYDRRSKAGRKYSVITKRVNYRMYRIRVVWEEVVLNT